MYAQVEEPIAKRIVMHMHITERIRVLLRTRLSRCALVDNHVRLQLFVLA